MATGVVSGAVALMLQANPGFTPDRVKHALAATARDAASSDPMAVGAGVVDVNAAAYSAPPGVANQGLARSNGHGQPRPQPRVGAGARPTTRSAPSSARSSGPP